MKNFQTWLLANGIRLRELYDQATVAAAWKLYLRFLLGGHDAGLRAAELLSAGILAATDEHNAATQVTKLDAVSFTLLNKHANLIARKPIESASLMTPGPPPSEAEGVIHLEDRVVGGFPFLEIWDVDAEPRAHAPLTIVHSHPKSEREYVIKRVTLSLATYVNVSDGELSSAIRDLTAGSAVLCRLIEIVHKNCGRRISIEASTAIPSGAFALSTCTVQINKTKNTTHKKRMKTIVFELCNAAHQIDFIAASKALKSGTIKDPFKFAKLYEQIEYRSVLIAIDILTEGNKYGGWDIAIDYQKTWGEHFKVQRESGHTGHYISEAQRIKRDMEQARNIAYRDADHFRLRFANDTKLNEKYGSDKVTLAVEQVIEGGTLEDARVMALLKQ